MEMIAQLEARLAAAEAAGDLETAEALRGAIERLRSGESKLTEQRPGAMGLGSSQEDYVADRSGKPLRKPDPMNRGHSRGGRR
jgi:hypothetical protein